MRTTRIMMGAVAAVALLGLCTQTAGAGSFEHPQVVATHAALTDLSTSTTDPTDGASGAAIAVSAQGRTHVLLLLSGLDRAQAGVEYGAHVHVGPCVAGTGAAAGPHYNSTGGATIDASTEVWLDFTIGARGGGFAAATVPFVIPSGGAGSIVIHAMPTAPNGTAGARLACLPMAF